MREIRTHDDAYVFQGQGRLDGGDGRSRVFVTGQEGHTGKIGSDDLQKRQLDLEAVLSLMRPSMPDHAGLGGANLGQCFVDRDRPQRSGEFGRLGQRKAGKAHEMGRTDEQEAGEGARPSLQRTVGGRRYRARIDESGMGNDQESRPGFELGPGGTGQQAAHGGF